MSPADHDLSESAFRRDGYLLKKGFFLREQVESVRRGVVDLFLRQMARARIPLPDSDDEVGVLRAMSALFTEDRVAFINCGKNAQNLVDLHRLGLNESLLDEVKRLGVLQPNICTRPVVFFNHPDLAEQEAYYKTPAHQDWLSMQGSLNLMVVWVPLIDIPTSLGALQIVPGSHATRLYEPDAPPVAGFIGIEGLPDSAFLDVAVEAGDALFFSAFLVHRSGNNVVDRIRWSCHFRYNDVAESTFIERRYPSPYIYRPTHERPTPGFPDSRILTSYFGRRRD